MRIGVDVGGTFTDITALDSAGSFWISKVPSTPSDQSQALIDGVASVLGKSGHVADAVTYLGHGTTVATNTLLELSGSRTALVVTKGFKDVLEIGRQKRPSLYDLFVDKPQILVPRRHIFEIDERIDYLGNPIREVTESDMEALRDSLTSTEGIDAIAVCFLHSYRDATHEKQVADRITQWFPERYVTRSSVVAPEFREYERMSTTVINAFVGPRMHRYVSRLERRSSEAGVSAAPKIIQSNGGMASPSSIVARPVTTLLSGPSAGVLGAAWTAALSGYRDIITFDMGGTSTDVCLVRGGEATVASERSVDGYVVRTPSVNVHTVGAGGGSIAKVDEAGALNVGPRSAGAVPGPAAYGKGGKDATVTDANILLGRQNPNQVIGDGLHLDLQAARRAIETLSEPTGSDAQQAALGTLRIANSHMARAVRRVSVDNGDDPRDLSLFAYGGAGPLHAVEVAKEVGIKKVLIPPHPGTLSALGLLVSEVRTEILRSCLISLSEGVAGVRGVIEDLRDQARLWFTEEGVPETERVIEFTLEMRYKRQNFELPVDIGDGIISDDNVGSISEAFHAIHEKTYGFYHVNSELTVVNVKVIARQPIGPPVANTLSSRKTGSVEEARISRRTVTYDEATGQTPIYARDLLMAGDTITGPAVIEQEDCTISLPPGHRAAVDTYGTLIVEVRV